MIKKPAEDKTSAAGTRSLLVQKANCISCDKPVNVFRESPTLPSLPQPKGLPGTKSSRPYTTFELDDIRQQMLQGQKPRNSERAFLESLGQANAQSELIKLG